MTGAVIESFLPSPTDLGDLLPRGTPAKIRYVDLNGSRGCAAYVGQCKALLSLDRAGGRDWYHVSVSHYEVGEAPILPTWDELSDVREALFRPDVVVVQVFPPQAEWYSVADVLHLWQRIGADRLVPDLRKGGAL